MDRATRAALLRAARGGGRPGRGGFLGQAPVGLGSRPGWTRIGTRSDSDRDPVGLGLRPGDRCGHALVRGPGTCQRVSSRHVSRVEVEGGEGEVYYIYIYIYILYTYIIYAPSLMPRCCAAARPAARAPAGRAAADSGARAKRARRCMLQHPLSSAGLRRSPSRHSGVHCKRCRGAEGREGREAPIPAPLLLLLLFHCYCHCHTTILQCASFSDAIPAPRRSARRWPAPRPPRRASGLAANGRQPCLRVPRTAGLTQSGSSLRVPGQIALRLGPSDAGSESESESRRFGLRRALRPLLSAPRPAGPYTASPGLGSRTDSDSDAGPRLGLRVRKRQDLGPEPAPVTTVRPAIRPAGRFRRIPPGGRGRICQTSFDHLDHRWTILAIV